MTRNNASLSRRSRWSRFSSVAPVAVFALAAVGCTRESNLTITVDRYVNNAMQASMSDQTGEPLEVDVVVLTRADLAKDANRDLKLGSGITSEAWFTRHPSSTSPQRFDVPMSQITRQTLVGREIPANKQATYEFKELKARANMPGYCLIYVFPEFIGRGGSRLPAAPAVYENPNSDIRAFIGVESGKLSAAPTYGQFIRRD